MNLELNWKVKNYLVVLVDRFLSHPFYNSYWEHTAYSIHSVHCPASILALDPSLSFPLTPPISCGGPSSTPGPLFLQLFVLFLRLKFTAPQTPPPTSPYSTPPLLHLQPSPQTNAAGLRCVGTAGLQRDNPRLYAFIRLRSTHTLNTLLFLLLQRFPLNLTFGGCIRLHLKYIVVHVIIHV